MPDFIKAILLGIVEGLTEFLPISSTGHLIIVEDFLSLSMSHPETFSISIQLGAILAVVIYNYDYFKTLLFKEPWFSQKMNSIIIASLPVLILGFFAYSAIKTYLFSINTVIASLFVGAILMYFGDRYSRNNKIHTSADLNSITYKQAFMIGCFQCLSLWPGFSRSGSTIIGGLFSGLSHSIAAEFSFIIAVPIMFIAVGYDLLKSAPMLSIHDLQLIGIGFIVSFIIGYCSIVWFLKILKKSSLIPFVIYRICLSGVLFIWLK